VHSRDGDLSRGRPQAAARSEAKRPGEDGGEALALDKSMALRYPRNRPLPKGDFSLYLFESGFLSIILFA
jgi:hypothetical protein